MDIYTSVSVFISILSGQITSKFLNLNVSGILGGIPSLTFYHHLGDQPAVKGASEKIAHGSQVKLPKLHGKKKDS